MQQQQQQQQQQQGSGGSSSGGAAGGAAAGGSFAAQGRAQQHALTWPKLRALGAGFWLTQQSALRATADALATAQFAATKDAHEPALLYAALGKKAVLQGLFRSSGNKKVADFLARDFSSAEGRAAASKNAFHLLGQHRYSLAAVRALHLLGQHRYSLAAVCVFCLLGQRRYSLAAGILE
ncbi:hypothetical protein OEZ86_012786 [Tetradesmus obliquus]|nr:hypothetical protein OEZ86_012786 [Tetradesmus obliquus]